MLETLSGPGDSVKLQLKTVSLDGIFQTPGFCAQGPTVVSDCRCTAGLQLLECSIGALGMIMFPGHTLNCRLGQACQDRGHSSDPEPSFSSLSCRCVGRPCQGLLSGIVVGVAGQICDRASSGSRSRAPPQWPLARFCPPCDLPCPWSHCCFPG